MKSSIRKGFGFGLTSGIITTLGLIVGVNASTNTKAVVIGAVLVIAIADSLSDALGIHVSEEAELKHSVKEIWISTISTFVSKFIFALTFLVPILLLDLNTAVIVSIIWGLGLISVFSYYLARKQNIKPHVAIAEHLLIAIVVIVLTNLVGNWISLLG